MMKLIAYITIFMLWFGLVASPTLLACLLGLLLWQTTGQFLTIPLFAAAGALVGVLWAERVRKGVGLSAFWGRLLGHPDIDGSTTDNKNT